jgi:ankyrin repeat protein
VAVVKMLLKKGVDPDSRDNRGRTPLSSAARKHHEAVVRMLQEHRISDGLQVSERSTINTTPNKLHVDVGD